MILKIGNHLKGQRSKQNFRNRLFCPDHFHMALASEKGLTLIEVLTAVSILAIGIIGVLQAYAGSITTLEVGQYNINAVNILKEKMNDIEEMIITSDSFDVSGSGTEGDFQWKWDLSSTDAQYLKKLTLTVSSKLNPRAFTLTSYVVEKEEEEL